MSVPAPSSEIESIAFLLGTWRGQGHGTYPTIAAFDFGEEVRFWHVGKPFIAYTQRTWALDDARPLHAEMGYWRPKPGGALEVVMAHPTGVVEIELGRVEGLRIDLATSLVGRTPSAKEVERLERTFILDGDTLSYEVRMAAVGRPLQHHLSCSMQRI